MERESEASPGKKQSYFEKLADDEPSFWNIPWEVQVPGQAYQPINASLTMDFFYLLEGQMLFSPGANIECFCWKWMEEIRFYMRCKKFYFYFEIDKWFKYNQ